MKRNFTKRKVSAKKITSSHWRRVMGVTLFVAFFSGLGFLFFQYKKNTLSSFFSSYFGQVENWIAARKNHLQKGLANDENKTKKKPVIAQKNPPPRPIHFEFYTALPNMQVDMPTPIVEMKKPEVVKTVAEKKKQTSKNIAVVSAEELEKELAEHFKQANYIVQLGVFRTSAAAYKYHKAMTEAGFQASVVPLRSAQKETYRVQLGPFFNKLEAKGAQLKLKKQGMDGIVLKL